VEHQHRQTLNLSQEASVIIDGKKMRGGKGRIIVENLPESLQKIEAFLVEYVSVIAQLFY
jgi:hypothetical protein